MSVWVIREICTCAGLFTEYARVLGLLELGGARCRVRFRMDRCCPQHSWSIFMFDHKASGHNDGQIDGQKSDRVRLRVDRRCPPHRFLTAYE